MSDSRQRVVIGLTGNIATGKSAIMKLAADKGALTLDADKVVHDLLNHSDEIQQAVVAAFGAEVRRSDGRVNRPALARIVFNDPAALQRLEGIIHPAVRREVMAQIERSEAQIIFIEAIKLLEGELAQVCDHIWVAHCSPQLQLDRLMICRGMDEETARMRIDAQSPQVDKVAQADVVIDTTGTLAETREQMEQAWPELREPVRAPAALPRAEEGAVARRARPSDVPGILLLIHKATGGQVRMKRTELLLAFSERSFFLGQLDATINCVFGAYIDSGIARVDQMYVHPPEAIERTAPAVLEKIEQSAREHFCELILVFPPLNAEPALLALLEAAGYERRQSDALHRVWQQAVEESQPADTLIMLKVLRDIRNVGRV